MSRAYTSNHPYRVMDIVRQPVPMLSGAWIAAGVIATALADVVLLRWAHLRIDISWASIALGAWGVGALAAGYRLRAPATRAARVARDLIEGVSLFAVISLLSAIATYPLAAGKHGFVDPELERIDLGLHFHWVSWYELVARHAWIQPVERLAYVSIFFTPAILIATFAWTGRKAECRLFIATFWLTALMTLAAFPFMPAAGPLATLWHGALPYMPLSALYQDQVILGLRDHVIQSVDLGALHGLVCAPSFHAASAIVYMAAGFRIPRLRWLIAFLNAAMLLATPVEGTHYLVDLLSGFVVAAIGIWLAPILIAATQRLNHPAPAPFLARRSE